MVSQILATLALMLFAASFIFGFEPQITRYTTKEVPPMSFQDYMVGSVKQNGDTVFVKALTAVAYPGAIAGVLVHNKFFAD